MSQTFKHLCETRDWLLADGATGTNLFHAGLEPVIRRNYGMLNIRTV